MAPTVAFNRARARPVHLKLDQWSSPLRSAPEHELELCGGGQQHRVPFGRGDQLQTEGPLIGRLIAGQGAKLALKDHLWPNLGASLPHGTATDSAPSQLSSISSRSRDQLKSARWLFSSARSQRAARFRQSAYATARALTSFPRFGCRGRRSGDGCEPRAPARDRSLCRNCPGTIPWTHAN